MISRSQLGARHWSKSGGGGAYIRGVQWWIPAGFRGVRTPLSDLTLV